MVLAAAGCPTEIVYDDAGPTEDGGAPQSDGGDVGVDGGQADAGACDNRQIPGLIVTAFEPPNTNVCSGTATAYDGSQNESLTFVPTACQWYGAVNKAGTYDVTVTAAGYSPGVWEDVIVVVDRCGRATTKQISVPLLRPDAGPGGPPDSGAAGDGGL